MKITSGRISGFEAPKPPTKETKDKQPALKTAKTDVVSFKSGDVKTDAQFIESLKTQILNEARLGADIHKLDDLKKQIALGEYDVNPSDIIHKMMHE